MVLLLPPAKKELILQEQDTTIIKLKSTGVETLLGDPKRAIFRLGLPMIIGMSVQTMYNLTDAIWVSGLGPDALSAVGLYFPFFMIAISLSVGLGIGGGSAVSRYIGANNKDNADKVATHTIVSMIAITILFTVPFILLCRPLYSAMGAGKALEMTVTYARIMFGGAIFIFFTNVGNALLRSEGDAKRAMYAMLAGSVLNMILDPILIYPLGLGVAGAAWATVISMALVSLVVFYWLYIEKKTYLNFSLKHFHFRRQFLFDIFKVGIPSSAAQLSMSVMMLFLNIILARVNGTDGVAIFATGWRIIMIAILPIIGIATAVVSVSGAAFGAKDYDKLDISFSYAIKTVFLIETVLAAITFVCAPYISRIFTWSSQSANLFNDITLFVKISCFFYPAAVLGIFSGSMFQGIGKGFYALTITIIRTIILTIPLSWLFGLHMQKGLAGVWVGMVAGTWIAVIIGFVWAKVYIIKLRLKSEELNAKKEYN